jgi:hypothetical protein
MSERGKRRNGIRTHSKSSDIRSSLTNIPSRYSSIRSPSNSIESQFGTQHRTSTNTTAEGNSNVQSWHFENELWK